MFPLLPRRLWTAGGWRLARRQTRIEVLALLLLSSAFAAAQVEAWLEGHAPAAGSPGS